MKSNRQYQKEFKNRMIEGGMIQVQSWIPKEKKSELARFVARLKETAPVTVKTV